MKFFEKQSQGLFQYILKLFLAGVAFGIGITTATVLAVTVTGTIKTWSSGETLKASDLNTTITSLKNAIEGIPEANLLAKTTSGATASAALTQITTDLGATYRVATAFEALAIAATQKTSVLTTDEWFWVHGAANSFDMTAAAARNYIDIDATLGACSAGNNIAISKRSSGALLSKCLPSTQVYKVLAVLK